MSHHGGRLTFPHRREIVPSGFIDGSISRPLERSIMRFPIGLTRLPLPQFTWASIDKQVEKPQPAPSELTVETTTKEDNNE
jgi:hypothetical protein